MISLGVKNFRNLKDTGKIEIKPLNFLLGANSSGKSSFLRIFPLLRQSIEVPTKGPILWFGDYVDFGDFHTVVTNGKKEIVFQFEFDLVGGEKIHGFPGRIHLENNTKFQINIHIRDISEATYIEKIAIIYEDQNIIIKYSKDNKIINIECNESDFSKGVESLTISNQGKGIIPKIYSQYTSEKKQMLSQGTDMFFRERLHSFIKERLRKGTTEDVIKRISNIGLGNKDFVLNQLKKDYWPTSWLKKITTWNIEHSEFILLNNLLIGYKIGSLIDLLNDEIQANFEDFYYVAPLRAIAERYYRRQNLSVTEVDFQGKNLPMYINNMPPAVLSKFQDWVETFFQYYPQTSSYEGHISLKLVDRKTDESFNITDRGFGYSQLLPIITMIWSIINNRKTNGRYWNRNSGERCVTIAIEQPELHLHPALQARMIDVFVSSIELALRNKIILKFVIETHSETMINYIGNKIL